MGFTLYTQPGCTRCPKVEEKLLERGETVEVLTDATLASLPDPMRRAELMSLIQLRERDDLPVIFRDDAVIEIEDLGISL